MDWTLAIERNTTALERIVATLVGMAGIGATPTSPSRGEVAARSAAGGGGALSHGGGGAAHPTPARCADPPPQGEGDVAARPTLPRRLHRAVLRLLRPAESAVRRLIVIAARGLVVPPSPLRPAKPKPPSIFLRRGSRGTGIVLPRTLPGTVYFSAQKQRLLASGAGGKVNCPQRISLPLFDALKRPFRRHRPTPICEPRISYPGPFNRLSPVKIRCSPSPDDRLDATRLTLRLQALSAALDDLPRQAQRLARWRANRARDKNRDAEAAFLAPTAWGRGTERSEGVRGSAPTPQVKAPRRFRRLSPLRPGRPPGSLRRRDHEIHDLLTELHCLAFDVLEHPDTS